MAQLGDKQWYIVTCQSQHERKVADNLKKRIDSMGMQDYIFDVLVAEQEFPVLKDGLPTGKTKMKNLYPGYIFVQMIMTDSIWYNVRNAPGVTGIAGSAGGVAAGHFHINFLRNAGETGNAGLDQIIHPEQFSDAAVHGGFDFIEAADIVFLEDRGHGTQILKPDSPGQQCFFQACVEFFGHVRRCRNSDNRGQHG